MPDGRKLLFIGTREGKTGTYLFEQSLDGSPALILRPAEEWDLLISADGKWTAGRIDDTRVRLVREFVAEEQIIEASETLGPLIGWSGDGGALFFYRQGEIPAAIYQLDIGTGEVSVVRRLMPPNRAGVWRIHPVVMSDDCQSFAYSASRWMSDLYVFGGLH
jgi:hypothetical protein